MTDEELISWLKENHKGLYDRLLDLAILNQMDPKEAESIIDQINKVIQE